MFKPNFKYTQAVHKELKKMIELGVIEPKGENKAIYYIPKTG